jgi:uncharacterized Zn-finger protein
MPPKQNPFETIQVPGREVACDGGGGALGHPKVYLYLDHDQGDKIVCPYCSRMFVLLSSHARVAS